MGWQDLIAEKEELVLPWTGGREVFCRNRSWKIEGRFPHEFDWFRFQIDGGRKTNLLGQAELDPSFEEGHPLVKGYLVGNRLIPDNARVTPEPEKFIDQTIEVFIPERGLERFTRAVVVRLPNGHHVYVRQEFPLGPESEVQEAYQNRKDSVNGIPGVTPALDLAFRFVSRERILTEARAVELERIRVEEEAKRAKEERFKEALKNAGTGAGRRSLALVDFDAAARAALAISGAEFVDSRDSYNRGEKVVQYRFMGYSLECTVNCNTLGIIDSGICLTNERTGEKGDDRFSLESLPAVVACAVREHKLVIYRHGDGYNGRANNYDNLDGDYEDD